MTVVEEIVRETDNETEAAVFDEATQLFVQRLPVPRIFFKFLLGKGGKVKTKLQAETGGKLIIPKSETGPEEISM